MTGIEIDIYKKIASIAQEIKTAEEKMPNLLDYFAAKAMQAIVSCHGYASMPENVAKKAYEIAQAMVTEKNNRSNA